MPPKVSVSVPASTANLGAGFDCLALALDLYNTVDFEEIESGLEITVEGEGAGQVPRDETNLIIRAAERVFAHVGRRPRGLRVRAVNGIPLGSGMGSSASAAVGGLAAANALVAGNLNRADLLRLAYELEGHPDNAAAAIYGQLTLVSATEDDWLVRSLAIAPMQMVIALPEIQLSTAEARAALPAQVPLKDAVFNIGRALFTVQALVEGDQVLLRQAMADKLHQPYRRKLITGYEAVEAAALQAGALAVALSGAGPALIAFTAGNWQPLIAAAMQRAFEAHGVRCRTFVAGVDGEGVRVSTEEKL
jgi:homoserine kinase